jgi:uncharacterized membrane protein YoaK (UPF0700 family)
MKVIHGYEVEVERDPDVEWSDCFVAKGGFSGTLAFLELHGELINHNTGETVEVNPGTIKAIQKWAEKNGY